MTSNLSLRARLTLWYTAVLVLVLCLFGADILVVQRRLGLRRVDRELDGLHQTVVNVLRNELNEDETPAAAAEEARDTSVSRGAGMAVLDGRGQVLAARLDGLDLGLLTRSDLGGMTARTVETAGGGWRVRAQPETFETPLDTVTLIVVAAMPLADAQREQRGMLEAMVLGIPIALLLAGAGGLWLASIGLRPIARMADEAGAISPGGVESLGDPGRRDELGRLAGAFNDLLARLRSTLKTQRQFMADASHELRTPVSVIRTAADVTLGLEHRDEADYRATLSIVGDQARRLSRLVEDMLVLARADAGGYVLSPVDLYLDEVVSDCRRAADVLAAGRGVTVTASRSGEVPFRGDEALLHRLLQNLVQNAVQHTPPGGTVAIDLQKADDGVRIRVADGGPGIPDADRQRIFDRFVQLDRARRGEGTGLGLPIARWIAEAHGGTIALETSGPGGSRFCVWLPGAV